MAKALSRICFFMIAELWAAGRKLLHPAGFIKANSSRTAATSCRRHIPIGWVNARQTLATEKEDMTRTDAIARARQQLHSGEFIAELDRRIAYPTESQNPERRDALRSYLEQELQPAFAQLDFSTRVIDTATGTNPYLIAGYRESSSAPTVLMYGHGDVVDGMAGEWRDNLDPWRATTAGNRVYGRGT